MNINNYSINTPYIQSTAEVASTILFSFKKASKDVIEANFEELQDFPYVALNMDVVIVANDKRNSSLTDALEKFSEEHRITKSIAERKELSNLAYIAALHGNLKVIAKLGKYNKELFDFPCALSKHTPAVIAAQNGHVAVLSLLHTFGIDLNQLSPSGINAMHMAVYCGRLDLILKLQEYGVSLEMETNQGQTPLYMAAKSGQLDIVQYLLEHGVTIKPWKTSLEDFFKSFGPYISDDKNTRVQELIEHQLSKAEQSDTISITPLEIAHIMGHNEIEVIIRQRQENLSKTKLQKHTMFNVTDAGEPTTLTTKLKK